MDRFILFSILILEIVLLLLVLQIEDTCDQ